MLEIKTENTSSISKDCTRVNTCIAILNNDKFNNKNINFYMYTAKHKKYCILYNYSVY